MSRITTLILAGTAFILLAGCANIDARREQRWAAFEPLRPDPEFRILPDRPLLKFEGSRPQPAELPEVQSSEAPVIWEAKICLKRGSAPLLPNFTLRLSKFTSRRSSRWSANWSPAR